MSSLSDLDETLLALFFHFQGNTSPPFVINSLHGRNTRRASARPVPRYPASPLFRSPLCVCRRIIPCPQGGKVTHAFSHSPWALFTVAAFDHCQWSTGTTGHPCGVCVGGHHGSVEGFINRDWSASLVGRSFKSDGTHGRSGARSCGQGVTIP